MPERWPIGKALDDAIALEVMGWRAIDVWDEVPNWDGWGRELPTPPVKAVALSPDQVWLGSESAPGRLRLKVARAYACPGGGWWEPSRNIEQAMRVIDHFTLPCFVRIERTVGPAWGCMLRVSHAMEGFGETPAHAICVAALNSVRGAR